MHAKVITLANHKEYRKHNELIKIRSKYMTRSAGNLYKRGGLGLGFTSDWIKKWREFFKPIVWRSYAKTIFLDTRVKTTLSTSSLCLRTLAYT